MSEDIDYDYRLKLLLIGDTSTEKPLFLLRYTGDSFDINSPEFILLEFVSIIVIYDK